MGRSSGQHLILRGPREPSYTLNVTSSLECAWCGESFHRPHDRGPAPKYCSPGHRQRASEARRAGRVGVGASRLRERFLMDVLGDASRPTKATIAGHLFGTSAYESAKWMREPPMSFETTTLVDARKFTGSFEVLGSMLAHERVVHALSAEALGQASISRTVGLAAEMARSMRLATFPAAAVSGALADLGKLQVTPPVFAAIQAFESAALVKSALPRLEWLMTASLADRQTVSITGVGGIAERIANGAVKLATMGFPSAEIARSFELGLGGWHRIAIDLPPAPIPSTLGRLSLAGSMTSATLDGLSQLTTRGRSSYSVSFESAVISEETFTRMLSSFGSDVVAQWHGVCERVTEGGSDATSQAAHSVVELIDRLCHNQARDDEVLRWHRTEGRSTNELHDGRPTRVLRLRFVMRNREGDLDAAEAIFKALNGIIAYLQKQKHGDDGAGIRTIARLLPGVQAMLYFVFGYED